MGKSLLRFVKSQDRYYTHELLRQYGAEKVAQHVEEMEELHDRHSQYYCQWFANQVTPGTLKSAGQKTVLDAMTAEIENARTAWSWALQNHRIKRLLSRTTALGMYYIWRGGYQEGEWTFRAFANHLSDVDESTDASSALLQASVLNWQGFFLYDLGDRTKALDLLFESQSLVNLPLLAKMDTRAERAHNLMNIARADWSQSDDVRLDITVPTGFSGGLFFHSGSATVERTGWEYCVDIYSDTHAYGTYDGFYDTFRDSGDLVFLIECDELYLKLVS